MKKCEYCGREADDETSYCHECGTQFPPEVAPDNTEKPSPTVQGTLDAWEVTGTANLWAARDAWKCLGMLLVFWFVAGLAVAALTAHFPGLHYWTRQGVGRFIGYSVQFSILVLTALYFARMKSVEAFLKTFGLDRPPSSYVWFAVVVTLVLRGTSHMLIVYGLSKGVTNTSVRGFLHTVGVTRYFYLAPALMAPFCEELYMRGFLYRAFRGSYSVHSSTALIVAITAILHVDQFLQSWAAVMSISALTVLQCFLRERTGNLWDCIICHLVFNATSILASLLRHG